MIKTTTKQTLVAAAGFWAVVLSGASVAAQPAGGGTPSAAISSVVVYGDRAQITRKMMVNCASGSARFDGMPSTLDAKTLWARVPKQPSAVVGLTHKEVATGPQPRAAALKKEVAEIRRQLARLGAQVAAADLQEQKLRGFRSHLSRTWNFQAAQAKPPLTTWDQALNLLRSRALQAQRSRSKAVAEQRRLNRELAQRQQLLDQIAREQRRTTVEATVMLRCTGQQPLLLSYMVPYASWQMTYQARLDTARNQVQISAHALVAQSTGEDWTNVRLAVSTANLGRKKTVPELHSISVGAYEPASQTKVLTRRTEHRKHLRTSALGGSSGQGGGGAAGGAGARQDHSLAMELPVSDRVTVAGDGRQILVTLEKKAVRAQTELETVPKLFPYVYRRLSLKNPFAFTMLPGELEIFLDGNFVGKTQGKLRAPGEPFALSLGVNRQVQVHRYVKKEKKVGPTALGAETQLRHRYVIVVGNWSKKRKTVTVKENIPVSRQREIKVRLGDDATKPQAWNKEDGILTWTLKIPPHQKKKTVVSYTVTLPEEYKVHGY